MHQIWRFNRKIVSHGRILFREVGTHSELMAAANSEVLENVKEYYGKVLQSSSDLQTQACVAPGRRVTGPVRDAISSVHEAVSARYYGCGLVLPPCVEGCSILDLGSGSGRDCFALSRLVGSSGKIIGVDMTEEQNTTARQYIDYHTTKFGYESPNVEFVTGYIEDLAAAGLQSDSVDIIVSNCVVNLSPDKMAVLSEAYRVLKPGGELYFSDVYTDTYLGEETRKDKVLWGECIAGALHWEQVHELGQELGFSPPFLVSCSPISIDREDFKAILGDAKFCSVTYRLFKIPPAAKHFASGQVIYNGEVPGHEESLPFDHVTSFTTGTPACVRGEVVTALYNSRFFEEFEFAPGMKEGASQAVERENPFDVIEAKVESACCGPSEKCC